MLLRFSSLSPAVARSILALITLALLPAGCGSSGSGSSSSTPSGPPQVDSVWPTQAAEIGGTPITIRTTNFSSDFLRDLPTVTFGAQPATAVTARSRSTVLVDAPPMATATPVDITLTSFDGQESDTMPSVVDYTTTPILSRIFPGSGDPAGGLTVTIEGDNFRRSGRTTVTFGSIDSPSVDVQDRYTMTCVTPASPAGVVTVMVTNPNPRNEQGWLTDGFTFAGVDPAVLSMEARVFDLINQERAIVGRPPLNHDPDIRLVSRAHSEDMRDRDFFLHQNPDGDWPWDRLDAAGISWRDVAENIAWNQNAGDPAQYVVDQWMASTQGHRETLLDSSNIGYSLTGVGVSRNASGRWWFTQVFVRP
ncbi:MAG: IPT/TIG domain-containing protein [Planctomycetota bacterium]|nr:IPT/TIG domain-containing protein [Planctomycetota bacterium]